MGFDGDKYRGSTGRFITKEEKNLLVQEGIPFQVVGIRQVFKFDKENYELTILMPDPTTGEEEERVLTFPIGSGAESRDAQLAGLAAHFEENDEPWTAKMYQQGRGYYLQNA